ncbi:histone acetyltransferase HPA2 [Bacillus horti]|uniref:Uncharacterized protein n=1 Tax=Caldalkalibacillus horti TaxID=77523 RepID=A0ABT9VYN1_9BACI|nr:histone acetyltransferase HPA2 [Bacillus horti]MDQ0166102.1 hypothetical protein [Bacillus horti]
MCKLKEMDDQDFEWFIEQAVHNFAQDKVENGSWDKETAIDQSRQAFSSLLPQISF